MKKILVISFASFFVSFYIFVGLANSYLSRVYYTGILAHFVLLIFICSTLFSISYFYYINYVRNRDLPFFVMALFFEIFGLTLFFHAVSIPSFYFLSDYIFDVTEHFGLFFAGLVLMLMFLPAGFADNLFYNHKKKIIISCISILILWFIFLLTFSGFAMLFFKYVNLFVFLSGVLLILGIVALLKKREEISQYTSFIYLIFGLSILLNIVIIPFFYKEWNIVWWYFHAIILFSGIVIFIGILKKCNKARKHHTELC